MANHGKSKRTLRSHQTTTSANGPFLVEVVSTSPSSSSSSSSSSIGSEVIEDDKDKARVSRRLLSFVSRIQLVAFLVTLLIVGSCSLQMPLLRSLVLPSPSSSQFEQLFLEVTDVLEAVSQQQEIDFWPTEGSLVGLLRYGGLSGYLGEGRMDLVDNDIDFMIGVQSDRDWNVLLPTLITTLTEKGWEGCVVSSTAQHLPSSRRDRLRCFKGGFSYRYLVKVDIHSFIVVKKDSIGFNHRWFDADTQQWNYGGYPFDAWDGRLPLHLLYPFSRCKCYDRVLNCPNKAVALLTKWNNYEYDKAGCLALPLTRTNRREQDVILEHSRKLHDQGFASFLREFDHPLCVQQILVANVSEGMLPLTL